LLSGSEHDPQVLNSPLWQTGLHRCAQGQCHIIGDSAYPVEKLLLTPYRDTGHLLAQEPLYNETLSKKRQVVERSFGILVSFSSTSIWCGHSRYVQTESFHHGFVYITQFVHPGWRHRFIQWNIYTTSNIKHVLNSKFRANIRCICVFGGSLTQCGEY